MHEKGYIYAGGDFKNLVEESSIFADKSLLLKFLIEAKAEVILITAPRRWGKTVNLDMVKRFI